LTDELALRKDMEKAAQAEAALSSPAIAEAFEVLEAEYFEAWKASESNQSDARERLWMAATIIGKVRSHLKQAIDNGKIAKAELDALATPGQSG
jgi:hypothetical protein